MQTTRFEACRAYYIEGYLRGAGVDDREAAEEAFNEHVHKLALSTERGQPSCVATPEVERMRDALRAIYNARGAGDWVTEPLQWCAEVARRALYPESTEYR